MTKKNSPLINRRITGTLLPHSRKRMAGVNLLAPEQAWSGISGRRVSLGIHLDERSRINGSGILSENLVLKSHLAI